MKRSEYITIAKAAIKHGIKKRWQPYVDGKIDDPSQNECCQLCENFDHDMCPMDDNNPSFCCNEYEHWSKHPTPSNAIPVLEKLKSINVEKFADELIERGLLERG